MKDQQKSKIRVTIVAIVIAMLFLLVPGCNMPDSCNSCTVCGNKQYFDFNYEYNYVILKLPDGTVVEGKVETWTDFSDGDQIQVRVNGVTYLVHSANCVLEYR